MLELGSDEETLAFRGTQNLSEINLSKKKMMAFLKGVVNGHKNDDSQLEILFPVG